jgi:ankyrin repeat protein
MASHEELLAEMPKLEKMSNAARLKLAKKRRALQMKRFLEMTRCSGGTQSKKKSSTKVNFEKCSLLHDAVQRNNMEEVEQLLKDGVCCNINNADGLTPLHRVSYQPLLYIVLWKYQTSGQLLLQQDIVNRLYLLLLHEIIRI